ncbi:MAG: hypothetical protein ABSH32_27930 [Bryobacteraceae bacterium]
MKIAARHFGDHVIAASLKFSSACPDVARAIPFRRSRDRRLIEASRRPRTLERRSDFGDHVIAASLKPEEPPRFAPPLFDFGDHVIAASLKPGMAP